MPNNSPFLSFGASIFKLPTCHLPTCHLPPTRVSLPSRPQPTPKPICHPHLPPRFVTASRPATLINAHHRLTTLPPSPLLALLCACLSLAPSLLFPPLFRLRRISFVPDAPFALHNFSITLQIVI